MAVAAAPRRSEFGAGELFLADSRLAFVVLNEVRHRALRRMFGVNRDQANLLTLVLVLSGSHVAVVTAEKVVTAPFRVAKVDLVIGGFTMREAAVGAAGPSAAAVSPFGTLLLIAVAGGMALPTLRRAARQARLLERRIRTLRERQYSNARQFMADSARKLRRDDEAPSTGDDEGIAVVVARERAKPALA
jgi:hypothetical protein